MNGNPASAALSAIRGALSGLAPRERRLVAIAGAATALVIVALVVSGLHSMRDSLAKKVAAEERELAEVASLRNTYLSLKEDADLLYVNPSSRPADFSLFAFLDGVGALAFKRERIAAMSPSSRTLEGGVTEESVEMKLSGVSLQKLTEFLWRLKRGPVPVRVSRMSVRKRFNEPTSLDVTLVVAMLTRAANELGSDAGL